MFCSYSITYHNTVFYCLGKVRDSYSIHSSSLPPADRHGPRVLCHTTLHFKVQPHSYEEDIAHVPALESSTLFESGVAESEQDY